MAGKSPLPRSFSPSATTARQRKVIELLSLGKKVREIADEMGGITEDGVRKLMRRALTAQAADLRSADAFDRAAATYLIRHDALMESWFPLAIGRTPNKDAADVVLKLMNLFADVYGLKAAIKVEPVSAGEGGHARVEAEVVEVVLGRLQELSERQRPAEIEGTATEVTEGDENRVTGQ